MWFYEHGFRSAGMFMYPPTLEYGTSALIGFDLPRHCMLIEVPYYPFKTRMQSRLLKVLVSVGTFYIFPASQHWVLQLHQEHEPPPKVDVFAPQAGRIFWICWGLALAHWGYVGGAGRTCGCQGQEKGHGKGFTSLSKGFFPCK